MGLRTTHMFGSQMKRTLVPLSKISSNPFFYFDHFSFLEALEFLPSSRIHLMDLEADLLASPFSE